MDALPSGAKPQSDPRWKTAVGRFRVAWHCPKGDDATAWRLGQRSSNIAVGSRVAYRSRPHTEVARFLLRATVAKGTLPPAPAKKSAGQWHRRSRIMGNDGPQFVLSSTGPSRQRNKGPTHEFRNSHRHPRCTARAASTAGVRHLGQQDVVGCVAVAEVCRAPLDCPIAALRAAEISDFGSAVGALPRISAKHLISNE